MIQILADIEKSISTTYYVVAIGAAFCSAALGASAAYYALKSKVAKLFDQMASVRKELADVKEDNQAQTKSVTQVQSDVRDISTRIQHHDLEAGESKRERAEILKTLTDLRVGMTAIVVKMNIQIPVQIEGR